MISVADAIQANTLDQVLHHFSEDVTVFGIDKSGGKGRAGELTHHSRAFYTEECGQHQAYKIKQNFQMLWAVNKVGLHNVTC